MKLDQTKTYVVLSSWVKGRLNMMNEAYHYQLCKELDVLDISYKEIKSSFNNKKSMSVLIDLSTTDNETIEKLALRHFQTETVTINNNTVTLNHLGNPQCDEFIGKLFLVDKDTAYDLECYIETENSHYIVA